ncbi:MAG TPA: hypothetical protein VGB76_16895 [Pyrinomonadaceae bacterium]|jgi:hypothetical protein
MKPRINGSLLIFVALLFCASFLVVRNVLTQGAANSTQATASLRERAKRNGNVIVKVFPHSLKRYDSLNDLTKESSAVILGTVISQASSLKLPAENSVTTNYLVRVNNVLKGDLSKESLVSVNSPGGKVALEGGAYAEMAMPDYWKTPHVEKTYVLFLTPGDGNDYGILGGPQGLFEATASGIKPQGLLTDELFRSHHGMSLKKFTHRVRSAIENHERAALRGQSPN